MAITNNTIATPKKKTLEQDSDGQEQYQDKGDENMGIVCNVLNLKFVRNLNNANNILNQ